MNLWLRLYTEVVNDPKVQKLDGESFKVWVNLLCIAKETDRSGSLPPLSDLIFLLRMEEKKLEKKITILKNSGLIEGNENLSIPSWTGRQYESDGDRSALERKKRQRKKLADTMAQRERTTLPVAEKPINTEDSATTSEKSSLKTESITRDSSVDVPMNPDSVTRDTMDTVTTKFENVTRTEQRQSRVRERAETEQSEITLPPDAEIVLMDWVKRRNQAIGQLVGFDERDRKAATQAMAKLGGNKELALSCVEFYFASWRNLWFACQQGNRGKPPGTRRAQYCFRSFADNIEACIPPALPAQQLQIRTDGDEPMF